MRFNYLKLEKYGVYADKRISLEEGPGLIVVYGANEAGKSTCLAAISDFLFGIQRSSVYGQIFGYDQIRLEAALCLSNGRRVVLRRRKGTAKTLTDENGQVQDEAVLSSILGSTTRERFAALFGLGHAALREGGQHLLEADGDIGRLIVEAGGGLRALVGTISSLDAEANKLFAIRRSAERAFYRAYDEFDKADRAAKADLKTRESYEQSRKQLAAADQAYEDLKAEHRALVERVAREERVLRVVPLLVELEQVDARIKSFSDLPSLPFDFAQAVRAATSSRDAARVACANAEQQLSTLEFQVKALVVPIDLLKVEGGIRDIVEKSIHIEKQRKDKPNRLIELSEQHAQLVTLRESIGVPIDADLAPLLPGKAILDDVLRLSTRGAELRSGIETSRKQIVGDEGSLTSFQQRQHRRKEQGYDKPFGVPANELKPLPRLAEELKLRVGSLTAAQKEIDRRLHAIGVSTLEALRDYRLPDLETVQAEIERQGLLEKDIAKHLEIIAIQTARREATLSEIGRLRAAGDVPNDAAIAVARGDRKMAWIPIRTAHLGEDEALLKRPLSERIQDVSLFEEKVSAADELADRKSIEAQRITDLASAEKQLVEAEAAIKSASELKEEAERKAKHSREEFAILWADAVALEAELPRLKTVLNKCAEIMELANSTENTFREIERLRIDHDPKLDLLSLAEQRLGIQTTPAATLQLRIQVVTREIEAHDEAHGGYRMDASAIEQLESRLQQQRNSLEILGKQHNEWLDEWRSAMRELSLPDDISLADANEVVREWSAAKGILEAIKSTQKRLSQFEDDERALSVLINAISMKLDFELPKDAVAAAQMLNQRLEEARRIETQRSILEPQLRQRTLDRDAKMRTLQSSDAALATLYAEANADETTIAHIVERHEQLIAAEKERSQLMATIQSAGDARPLEILHNEWANRDLDGIRADIAQFRQEIDRLQAAQEIAYAALQDRRRDVSSFESDGGINAYISGRERAAAEMHQVVDRYIEIVLARSLLDAALSRIRSEQQNPLLSRAGALFALTTRGAFSGIGTDIDENGRPVVIGKRTNGGDVTIGQMSDGTRDQLFLSFRLASVEHYCAATEPVPFVADDLLVHFDDERSAATLELLAEVGKATQVILFTHHKSVRDMAELLANAGKAAIVDLTSSSGMAL